MTAHHILVRTLALIACLSPMAAAQTTNGPDVVVGDMPSMANYGSSGGIAAFSVATTSCNYGNQNLLWEANNPNHPVIAQHMYRYKDGRFEMIGQSMLKHGFAALAGSLCGPCNGPGGALPYLLPGCSDPYSAGLNGQQSGLGPKCEVNATTGVFPYPFSNPSGSGLSNTTFKRLQVHHADLALAQNAGASYYVESHYIAWDDAAAGNDDNNASYRPVNISPNGGSYNASTTGTITIGDPAIYAWRDVHDPHVLIQEIDVSGDGRFIIAMRITPNNGLFEYEFAVHNLNSHRSARSFSVDVPAGANITNIGFRDVDYHSRDGDDLVQGNANGAPYDGTDWSTSTSGGQVAWSTAPEVVDPNANALRWGTMYNFRFTSDLPPANNEVIVHLGLYRGAADVVNVPFDLGTARDIQILSGDDQLAILGEQYAQPFSARLVHIFTAQPIANAPMTFGGSGGTAIGPNVVLTDANGVATVNAIAGPTVGAGFVTVSDGVSATEQFEVFARGIVVGQFGGLMGITCYDTFDGAPTVPYIIFAGTPGQPTTSTVIGDLCMNPLDPASAVVIADGVGAFGFTSLQGQPTVGTPALSQVYSGITGLTGQTLSFQFVAYNSGFPGNNGTGWWISNCFDYTFL